MTFAYTEHQFDITELAQKEIVMVKESNNEVEETVLQGTVIGIRPAQGQHLHQKWCVTLQVDSIVVGYYTEQTFSFSVHSPTKSGIVIGGQYMIHTVQIQNGEYQIKGIEPWKNQ